LANPLGWLFAAGLVGLVLGLSTLLLGMEMAQWRGAAGVRRQAVSGIGRR